MTVPSRQEAEAITWHIDGLLSDGFLLPPALAATLGAYREHLLRLCARQPWARPGNRASYARLADTLAANITDGTWKPGDRLPWLTHLEETYHAREKAMRHALFLLVIRATSPASALPTTCYRPRSIPPARSTSMYVTIPKCAYTLA